jgi:hypothetical protein
MTSKEGAGVPRRGVAAALARGVTPRVATSVRNYAKRSRAHGDTVQDVVKNLMELVRDATPNEAILAKRSCEVAEWAIAAYYEPESMGVAAWTDAIRPGSDRDYSVWRR